ncbi:MAG: ribose-5-phosphate isomerase [Solirubrobacterales bacterium]|nr:MAG: ribose-5-phosphate isomerase [Solirubrobacterales bacterium]
MKIACAFDHAGVPLRDAVLGAVRAAGHEPLDLGVSSPDPVDYPDIALRVTGEVISGAVQRGVLCCGSGAGVSVAASKVPGIRAATVHDEYSAHQCVEHDDVNVLCMGARVIGAALASEIVERYAGAHYTGGEPGSERHARRLAKVLEIEREALSGGLPPPGDG